MKLCILLFKPSGLYTADYRPVMTQSMNQDVYTIWNNNIKSPADDPKWAMDHANKLGIPVEQLCIGQISEIHETYMKINILGTKMTVFL